MPRDRLAAPRAAAGCAGQGALTAAARDGGTRHRLAADARRARRRRGRAPEHAGCGAGAAGGAPEAGQAAAALGALPLRTADAHHSCWARLQESIPLPAGQGARGRPNPHLHPEPYLNPDLNPYPDPSLNKPDPSPNPNPDPHQEREADQAKRDLAGGSGSDHIALVRALDGWVEGRHRFASRHFLSPTTLEYISRLRRDLADGARELLTRLPADHASPAYLHDVCRAVLVAGLSPNVACLRRFGKGETLGGLKVAAHPGSVNSRASGCVVVFFDLQETTDRYMYDTSVVSMAPLLLFAPVLHRLHATERRVTFGLGGGDGRGGGWRVAVDAAVAEDLLALREHLSEFVLRSVGQPPTAEHWAATDALGRLFSDHAPIAGMDDDDDEEGEEGGGAVVAPQPAAAVGRWVPSTKYARR